MREVTDLLRVIGEHVVLKPRGREHVGLCPFHDDRTPSLAVVTHKGNAFYKCHSCGAGGDAFDFVMNYHRMEFAEALRHLAEKANITLTPWKREDSGGDQPTGPRRIDVRKANAFAATFFRRTLAAPAGATAREVIANRGIADEMAETFALGAAPDAWDGLLNQIRRQNLPVEPFVSAGLLKVRREGDGHYDAFRNRVMFPICDKAGAPIAFGARKIDPDDEPKYLNSAESAVFNKSKTLYGLHLARRTIIERQTAIVTEGYTDVIACHQAGVTNVVATLGTALTREHARELGNLCTTVVLLFDGDEAGIKAADRALEVVFREAIDIRICVLPEGLDPDGLLKQAGGRERFDEALQTSVDALQFAIERSKPGTAGLDALLSRLIDLGFLHLPDVRRRQCLMQIAGHFKAFAHAVEAALQRLSAKSATRAESRPNNDLSSQQVPEQVDAFTGGWDHVEVSPLRRKAEFELLGVAIFEPLIASKAASDTHVGLFEPARFRHPTSIAIAAFVSERFAAGETFAVQELLAALADEPHRTTASQLYFDGRKACGDDDSRAGDAIRAAAEALEACIRREELDAVLTGASADAANPLMEVLHRRRQAGHIPSAISRGVRG